MDFYKDLAETYDDLTRYTERREEEKAVLQAWLKRYPFRTALDAGCGTGLHAIILAELGIKVTAADPSPEMLAKARAHGQEAGVKVNWVAAAFADLPRPAGPGFQAVLCLGNTLPHNLTFQELQRTLQNFQAALAPGGRLILQLLNYRRVLASRERITAIRRSRGKEFIRFYDFMPEGTVRFNVLTVEEKGGRLRHQLASTLLYPFQQKELEPQLRQAGFGQLEYFGDLKFNPYEPERSGDLVITGISH